MDIDAITEGLRERIDEGNKVDYLGLNEGLTTVTDIASLVLGYLIVIILILVPIITCAEIVYICFPVVREGIDELLVKVEGKGVPNRILGFCLRDAIKAVEESMVDGVGSKSALLIYLKLKCKSMMTIMFVICLVLRGFGGSPGDVNIFMWIWDKFRGFIDLIKNAVNG